MSVVKAFDKNATEYDAARKQLIPCFEDFYKIPVEILPYNLDRELRILDIGAGTGILSETLAKRYRRAQLTLVDISTNMLEIAEQRLATKYQDRVSFRQLDYATDSLRGTYDLVVSALSIHHLSGSEKAKLFKRIHSMLEPGGLFINCDQVLGENYVAEKLYQNIWLQQVRASGISAQALSQALERMKEDKLSPLSSQFKWLDEAGFVDVTTWYKHYSFVVYSGSRRL